MLDVALGRRNRDFQRWEPVLSLALEAECNYGRARRCTASIRTDPGSCGGSHFGLHNAENQQRGPFRVNVLLHCPTMAVHAGGPDLRWTSFVYLVGRHS